MSENESRPDAVQMSQIGESNSSDWKITFINQAYIFLFNVVVPPGSTQQTAKKS